MPIPTARHQLSAPWCARRPLAAPGGRASPCGQAGWRGAARRARQGSKPRTTAGSQATAIQLRTVDSTLGQQSNVLAQSTQYKALRAWIEEQGGYLHPSLAVVDTAPCGARGVITVDPLPLEVVTGGPLILVPERLYLTTDDVHSLLAPLRPGTGLGGLLPFRRQPQADALSGAVRLALLLAFERRKGAESFWAPYINCLPDTVPCAWALPDPELRSALRGISLPQAEQCWAHAVERARRGVRQRVEQAVQLYGRQLGVDEAQVTWALGQVLSRCFGREPDLGLAPFIDLCNHRHGAPTPRGGTSETDGSTYVSVEGTLFGEPHTFAAGEELYVSYSPSTDPLAVFLNLGFVPPELLAGQ